MAAARSLVRAKSARYGRARIERELEARGFSAETIARALSEGEYGGEEKSLELAFRRLWTAHASLAPEKRRQRVWNALMRRGFTPAAISAIMKDLGQFDEVDGSS